MTTEAMDAKCAGSWRFFANRLLAEIILACALEHGNVAGLGNKQ